MLTPDARLRSSSTRTDAATFPVSVSGVTNWPAYVAGLRQRGSLTVWFTDEAIKACVAERHPDANVVVPPRTTAVPSETAESAPTQRGRHLQRIAEHGRMAWQQASGYARRALAEAGIGRWKQVIGDELRAHKGACRATEVEAAAYAPKRMLELGRPNCVRTA